MKLSEMVNAATGGDAGGPSGLWSLTPNGSRCQLVALEEEITLSGATTATTITVPSGMLVFAVTARVTETITGSGDRYKLGWSSQHEKFGNMNQYGVGEGSRGVMNGPGVLDYSDTPIVLYSQLDNGDEGGSFSGGKVRVAIHYLLVTIPQS